MKILDLVRGNLTKQLRHGHLVFCLHFLSQCYSPKKNHTFKSFNAQSFNFKDIDALSFDLKQKQNTKRWRKMPLSFEYIDYQVEDGRARITLNRPEKRNALSIELVEELEMLFGKPMMIPLFIALF